ncbi:NAD(P)-binding protein [Mycena venus]|uniref:NAD(P)-binding protein n=1 Tax=Mycena venus TaxID=2733690 RepID=A0A8H6XAZ2_9AGAR|nr:NAD(P)-binding protein [Mycena venus]
MLPALLAAVLSIMIYLITTLSRRGPSFVPEDIPDLSDKTILITGGNSGIGYQTAKELLLKGATVYLSARSRKKAAEAIEKLERETKRTAKFLELDLADLRSVRGAATEFLKQESSLNVFFNNGKVGHSFGIDYG